MTWLRLKIRRREGVFSLLGNELIARRMRAEKSSGFEEELKNKMNETQVQVRSDREDDVLCAWEMKAIEDIAHSGWKKNVDF